MVEVILGRDLSPVNAGFGATSHVGLVGEKGFEHEVVLVLWREICWQVSKIAQ